MSSDTHPIPILTPGIEPTSGESHSPPSSFPIKGLWPSGKEEDAQSNLISVDPKQLPGGGTPGNETRKRMVVVGLGMVGIAFM